MTISPKHHTVLQQLIIIAKRAHTVAMWKPKEVVKLSAGVYVNQGVRY